MTKHKIQPLSEKTVHKAERHLSKSDAVMKRLIAEHGHCPLANWEYNPFHTLVTSIISQQLSSKAADIFTLLQVSSQFPHKYQQMYRYHFW